MDQPLKPARTPMEVMEAIIGQQAGLIARLQSAVEQIPALKAEVDELKKQLDALKAPAAPAE